MGIIWESWTKNKKIGGPLFLTPRFPKTEDGLHTEKNALQITCNIWKSNHSKNCLLGIIKGLVHQAHYFCDLKEDLLDEIDLLRDVFVMNGYRMQ